MNTLLESLVGQLSALPTSRQNEAISVLIRYLAELRSGDRIESPRDPLSGADLVLHHPNFPGRPYVIFEVALDRDRETMARRLDHVVAIGREANAVYAALVSQSELRIVDLLRNEEVPRMENSPFSSRDSSRPDAAPSYRVDSWSFGLRAGMSDRELKAIAYGEDED